MIFSRRKTNTQTKDEDIFQGKTYTAPKWPDMRESEAKSHSIDLTAEQQLPQQLDLSEVKTIELEEDLALYQEEYEEPEIRVPEQVEQVEEVSKTYHITERFARGQAVQAEAATPPPPTKEQKRAEEGTYESALAEGTVLEGKFKFDSPVRIDGTIRGQVSSKSTLLVGKTAEVTGHIEVDRLIVCGQVWGESIYANTIDVRASGRLEADIEVKSLIMEEGAFFRGNCKMDIRDMDIRDTDIEDINLATADVDLIDKIVRKRKSK